MEIKSDFAVLDVKKGRNKLRKHFEANPDLPVYVVICGWIDGQHGNDDGTSIEFSVSVSSVVTLED